MESQSKKMETKTPEEEWQNAEDERLAYEGYCRKIRQGLANESSNSGIRAIWELVQNARDQSYKSEGATIKMELTEKSFIFSHHGEPFDYTSFCSLVKQDSSKDRTDANLVGQYGTGFMTTHRFNRMVYVSAPYAVKNKDGVSGYVQIENFELDRTKVDTAEGTASMREQIDEVKAFYKRTQLPAVSDDTTSFRYDLQTEQLAEVSACLESAIRLMPFVMILNKVSDKSIKEIEIDDKHSDRHYSFQRRDEVSRLSFKEGWSEVDEVVEITDLRKGESEAYHCKSLKSDKGDVVIIPPYPEICGRVEDIPSLFLWFPLLGTEKFGVNFIFHSSRFYPVEKRNNIMLPGVSQTSKEKGGENERILKEIMQALFDYYKNAEHAATLSLEMCKVAFPDACDNEETERFYKEMQELWNKEVPTWKVLPIGDDRVSVDDSRVRLLHPTFYSKLNVEKRKEYEPVMAQYARLVKLADGTRILLPENDLIAWSELVDQWHCDNDVELFVNVADVCKSIKDNSENLHTFLMFLKDSGNEKLLEECPLLPNRKGDLCLRTSLYYGDFMTDDVYQLVSVMMGDAAAKMFDPAFLDVTTVSPYTKKDLQNAIANNIQQWRNAVLNKPDSTCLKDEQIEAVISFCSATALPEFKNQRGRMMPLVADYYEKLFRMSQTIKFRDDEEEEFYKAAFGFLLDYTLSCICRQDANWVEAKKSWLLDFLKEYSPKDNEERRDKLDKYGVLPNQNNVLCRKSDLKACKDVVPPEMVEIYKTMFGRDLKNEWVDPAFDNIVGLASISTEEVAEEIEKALVMDMKQDGEHKHERIVRQIILNLEPPKNWKQWFGQIEEKKANYTFNMQSGSAQKSLFSLMDNLNDNHLERLAKLSEKGNLDDLIEQLESFQKKDEDSTARFEHLNKIGKRIERILRERIGNDWVDVEMPANKKETLKADDIQDGQDIIVKVKVGNNWKNIYYIEVKSKWNFHVDQAHMSSSQIRMASLHPNEYALCCVDLRPYKNQNLAELPEDDVIKATHVKMNIGEQLAPMMAGILEADKKSDEEQIKIADYHSNMSAEVFVVGEPFDTLLQRIEDIAKEELKS